MSAARADALLRRVSNRITETSCRSIFGRLSINIRTKQVKSGDREIVLTQKEWELLDFLLLNKNVVVDKQQIQDGNI